MEKFLKEVFTEIIETLLNILHILWIPILLTICIFLCCYLFIRSGDKIIYRMTCYSQDKVIFDQEVYKVRIQRNGFTYKEKNSGQSGYMTATCNLEKKESK